MPLDLFPADEWEQPLEFLIAGRPARPEVPGAAEDPRLASLSAQEHRILELLAEGKTNRQIAADMFLAEKTVKNYVSNLLTKMGMSRRTEAAVYAARQAERHSHRP